MRTADERIETVRRILHAADVVYQERNRLAAEIGQYTGLTPEGVELGFQSLERDANDEDLRSLIASAGSARWVHVVLSSNVFVAPLRAIAIARAAADRVTVRPSPRDPVLACELVRVLGDPSVSVYDERDVAVVAADEVHVYGRRDHRLRAR